MGRIRHEFVCIDPPQVRDEYTRCKHWFREDELKNGNSAVVVSIFRDPMDWVEAMRSEPHHAHDHLHFRNDSQVELVRQEPTEDDRWWWELADREKNSSRSPGWDRRGPKDEELAPNEGRDRKRGVHEPIPFQRRHAVLAGRLVHVGGSRGVQVRVHERWVRAGIQQHTRPAKN